jgi:hypothetical protein
MSIFSNVPFDAIDTGRSLSVSRTMTPTDIETLTFVSGDIDAAQNAPIVLCKGDIAVTERGAHDEGEIDRPLKGIHRIARHQEQLCEGPEVDLDHWSTSRASAVRINAGSVLCDLISRAVSAKRRTSERIKACAPAA